MKISDPLGKVLLSEYHGIKYVSRCIHTPCSRRRATTFQKEGRRITSSEEEVTVMTRTTMAPVTSLSSQTTLFPPSLQGRRQEKRQLMKYNILILFKIMSLFTKSSRQKTGEVTVNEISSRVTHSRARSSSRRRSSGRQEETEVEYYIATDPNRN